MRILKGKFQTVIPQLFIIFLIHWYLAFVLFVLYELKGLCSGGFILLGNNISESE